MGGDIKEDNPPLIGRRRQLVEDILDLVDDDFTRRLKSYDKDKLSSDQKQEIAMKELKASIMALDDVKKSNISSRMAMFDGIPYRHDYFGSFRHYGPGLAPGWVKSQPGFGKHIFLGITLACVATGFLFWGIQGTWVKPLPRTMEADWKKATIERREREGVYDIDRHKIGQPVKYREWVLKEEDA